jgi:hypothetical protein
MREHLVLIDFQLDTKHSIRQGLKDRRHDFNRFFLRHLSLKRELGFTDKLRIVPRRPSFAKLVADTLDASRAKDLAGNMRHFIVS